MSVCGGGGAEVRDGLANTMLDLEECCRGGRRGQRLGFVYWIGGKVGKWN